LLWPAPAVESSPVVPLSSAVPLTVPGVQREAVGVDPPVQRVVYGHPALGGSAVPARTATAERADAVQAAAPEEQVLSWSAGETFHAEPAVQRVESSTVRAVSLEQMFSGHAAPEAAVQRDEAPPEAAVEPLPQPPAPAQAPPAPVAAAPAKTVSAAEVEELAKRLYEPLTAKLRAELWLDRERSGRVADRWH